MFLWYKTLKAQSNATKESLTWCLRSLRWHEAHFLYEQTPSLQAAQQNKQRRNPAPIEPIKAPSGVSRRALLLFIAIHRHNQNSAGGRESHQPSRPCSNASTTSSRECKDESIWLSCSCSGLLFLLRLLGDHAASWTRKYRSISLRPRDSVSDRSGSRCATASRAPRATRFSSRLLRNLVTVADDWRMSAIYQSFSH